MVVHLTPDQKVGCSSHLVLNNFFLFFFGAAGRFFYYVVNDERRKVLVVAASVPFSSFIFLTFWCHKENRQQSNGHPPSVLAQLGRFTWGITFYEMSIHQLDLRRLPPQQRPALPGSIPQRCLCECCAVGVACRMGRGLAQGSRTSTRDVFDGGGRVGNDG